MFFVAEEEIHIEYILPKEHTCPHCESVLALTDDERMAGKFKCPECDSFIESSGVRHLIAFQVQGLLNSDDSAWNSRQTRKIILFFLLPVSLLTAILLFVLLSRNSNSDARQPERIDYTIGQLQTPLDLYRNLLTQSREDSTNSLGDYNQQSSHDYSVGRAGWPPDFYDYIWTTRSALLNAYGLPTYNETSNNIEALTYNNSAENIRIIFTISDNVVTGAAKSYDGVSYARIPAIINQLEAWLIEAGFTMDGSAQDHVVLRKANRRVAIFYVSNGTGYNVAMLAGK